MDLARPINAFAIFNEILGLCAVIFVVSLIFAANLMPYKLIHIVGARPQFIKSAALDLVFSGDPHAELKTIHTGQHYDENMSDIFYSQLGLSKPQWNLQAGSHSHGKQTALMLEGTENVFLAEKPDMVIVYGDTNSTIAAALAAAKMQIPVAHIEAGLRSYNRSMPEEINRVLTDHISDLLFIPSENARQNLINEGINKSVINTGDIMLDVIRTVREKNLISPMVSNKYYYATIHRPYNTDSAERMQAILKAMNALQFPVYFAIHPRTSALLAKFGVDLAQYSNIHFIPPQGYVQNLGYMEHAEKIITDSGGVQKEAWYLKVPCITLRPETEWVETLQNDWNQLVFDNIENLAEAANKTPGDYIPAIYGDGYAAEKIKSAIIEFLQSASAA